LKISSRVCPYELYPAIYVLYHIGCVNVFPHCLWIFLLSTNRANISEGNSPVLNSFEGHSPSNSLFIKNYLLEDSKGL